MPVPAFPRAFPVPLSTHTCPRSSKHSSGRSSHVLAISLHQHHLHKRAVAPPPAPVPACLVKQCLSLHLPHMPVRPRSFLACPSFFLIKRSRTKRCVSQHPEQHPVRPDERPYHPMPQNPHNSCPRLPSSPVAPRMCMSLCPSVS